MGHQSSIDLGVCHQGQFFHIHQRQVVLPVCFQLTLLKKLRSPVSVDVARYFCVGHVLPVHACHSLKGLAPLALFRIRCPAQASALCPRIPWRRPPPSTTRLFARFVSEGSFSCFVVHKSAQVRNLLTFVWESTTGYLSGRQRTRAFGGIERVNKQKTSF